MNGRRRVLVVDDSALTRALLRRQLGAAGFEVSQAANGAEGALKAFRELPDVVVTDLDMPLIDGWQLARLLKDDPVTAGIPVVILTSHDEAPSRFWGLQTGADRYVTKDEVTDELVATVRELSARARGPAPPPENAPGGPMEVMARVARHLDQRLLHTTLLQNVLERGMEFGTFGETADALLGLVSELADADLIGFAVGEIHGVKVQLRRGASVSAAVEERLVAALVGSLGVEAGTPEIAVSGEPPGEVEPAGEAVVLTLPLREAAGALGLVPRSNGQFGERSRPLVESLLRHLGLVLDNARLADRLRELSRIDGLTRSLNHRAVMGRLSEEFERWDRYRLPVSVVLVDLDHFKSLNDRFGHLAGDAVLRAAARRLEDFLRTVDACGRYGGEEFLLVLPNVGLEEARSPALRMQERFAAEPITLADGLSVPVTASFGVACVDEIGGTPTPQRLIGLADERLYAAKAAGRNCVRP